MRFALTTVEAFSPVRLTQWFLVPAEAFHAFRVSAASFEDGATDRWVREHGQWIVSPTILTFEHPEHATQGALT